VPPFVGGHNTALVFLAFCGFPATTSRVSRDDFRNLYTVYVYMSDYLSDDEQVAALKKWWDDNGLAVIIGVVVVIAGTVGWRWYQDFTQKQDEAASSAYQQYVEMRSEEGNAAEIDAAAAAFINEHGDSGYATLVQLYQARDAVAAEDLEAAEKLLAAALEGADSSVKDVIRVRQARVLVQLGREDEALAALAAVKGQGFRSAVAEIKGDVLMARGDRTGAREAYQAAVDALEADQARPILKMKLNNVAAISDA
jgi:predicted negative regulator of RcsB-dependent stress response